MARRKKTNEDEPQENQENVNESDDNFGLPEVEYEPLNRSEVSEEPATGDSSQIASEEVVNSNPEYETEEVVEEHHHDDHIFNPTEEKSSAPKVIGILIFLIIIAGGAWFFLVYQPKKKEEERVKLEQAARAEAARKAAAEEQRLAEIRRAEEERRRADSLANATPKVGAIETLSGRTGRYYVVVASDIDDDLIMDYAKKLSQKGVSSTIIPPHGKVKFFRLAVASGDTYADAQSTADGMKGEYRGGAWVTRY